MLRNVLIAGREYSRLDLGEGSGRARVVVGMVEALGQVVGCSVMETSAKVDGRTGGCP